MSLISSAFGTSNEDVELVRPGHAFINLDESAALKIDPRGATPRAALSINGGQGNERSEVSPFQQTVSIGLSVEEKARPSVQSIEIGSDTTAQGQKLGPCGRLALLK